MADTILRERQMKKWNRAWKLRRMEDVNPDWRDFRVILHEADR
jgi:putative endonuclease